MGTKNNAYINSEMLKWARGETPFSSIQSVLERRPKYTIEQIEAWESGLDYPSITEAKDLATLYDVPFACLFFTSVPVKKPRPYTDRRTPYAYSANGISYELWREIRRLTTNREIAIELAPDYFSQNELLPAISNNEDISSVANKIRKYFDIKTPYRYKTHFGNSAFNYFRGIFENKGIMVAQLSGVSESEIRGLSIYNDLFPIIAVNNKDWERAKVFTLFHEIAHLLRRSSSLCLIDFDEQNDDEEKLCNSIAAEALLPEISFRRVISDMHRQPNEWDNLSLLAVADKYGVSTAVVLRRLYDLKIISRTYYYSRYHEMEIEVNESLKNRKSFPVLYHYRYLNQQGYLFPKIMLSAYSSGNISYGEMCRSLNINTMHIRNIEQAVMFR